MKPWRNQNMNMPSRRQAESGHSSGPSGSAPLAATPVHRYSHPIRTARPPQRISTEELLSYILETLSRQSEQLEELLRRTEGSSAGS